MSERTAAELLELAARDVRLLEIVDDHSIDATEEEAAQFEELGYARKVRFNCMSHELQTTYRKRSAHAGVCWLCRQAYCFRGLPGNVPDITPWSLLSYSSWQSYAESCSPEFLHAYELAFNRVEKYRDLHSRDSNAYYDQYYERRHEKPDGFMTYIVSDWYVSEREGMDRVNQVTDWLLERNELRVLASCFNGMAECDHLIMLATRAPEALQYLEPRYTCCDSNTVRDLFLLHGQGDKLNEEMLEPDLAVRHWDQVKPTGREWFKEDWTRILHEATELPKEPIPMFLLLEIGPLDKITRHLDYISTHCQGYDDYRDLYWRLFNEW